MRQPVALAWHNGRLYAAMNSRDSLDTLYPKMFTAEDNALGPSEPMLQVSQGALYPALHRLEQQGWIRAEWGTTDVGREAKFYELTRAGRTQLKKELAQWERLSSAMTLAIKLAPESDS